MSLSSIGDGMRQFHLQRENTSLKNTLNTLVTELSSGEKTDRVRAAGGDTTQFSAIDNRLKVLSSLSQLTQETQFKLSATQTMFDNLDRQRGALAEPLMLISANSPDFQIQEVSRASRNQVDGLVATLNTRLGGESLLSGTAVDQPALAPAAVMIADITAQIGGATDKDAIIAVIDTWFDDPNGGFATIGYTGDTGAQQQRRLDNMTSVTIDARADASEIKALLKGAMIATMAQEIPGLDRRTQADLLIEGGVRLQGAANDVAQIQSRLGYVESEVERVSVSQASEQSALTIARNLITRADPFETATELQSVQLQLETHYAMTARLSRLSLVEYLR